MDSTQTQENTDTSQTQENMDTSQTQENLESAQTQQGMDSSQTQQDMDSSQTQQNMDSSQTQEDSPKTLSQESLRALVNDSSTDFSQRDPEGRSYLHLAVLAKADTQLLQDLAERVDLSLRDQNGQTVLDLLPEDSLDLQEVLESKVKGVILAGGEAGEKEARRLLMAGWTHWPVTAQEAREKSEEAAQLLEKIMELKTKAEEVHKAAKEGRLEDLKQQLLGELSFLATAADSAGLLPLHMAIVGKQGEVVSYLASLSADIVNAADNMGRTALHYAAAMADGSDLFQTLKDSGADDTIKDLTGKTPTDYKEQPESFPLAAILKRLEQTTPTQTADDVSQQRADSTTATLGEQDSVLDQQEVTTPLERPKNPSPPVETKPATVTPVSMYVSRPERERAPPPTTVDGKYVAQHLGSALTLALAEIAERRPWDPVEYLAQWLYQHRRNLDQVEQQKVLLDQIRRDEEAANEEEIVKFKKKEEQRRVQEEERIRRAEEEAERKKKEQEELQRQAKEAMLAQKPQLPTVREEEGEDSMVRERDEQGQTELHLLAAQSGADLVAVMNLGYSLADRDASNKTARDIAEDQGLTDNVETIDNYVSNLLEQEKVDTLRQLVIEGYDKLDTVLSSVSTEGLPSTVTDFVNSLPELQERVSAVLSAVHGGVTSAVEDSLEDKSLVLVKDVYGRSLLHLALLAGHTDLVQSLVNNNPVLLKTRDNMNRTALHYAAALSEEMMELLETNGADVNAKDAKQNTPAYYSEEKEEILQLKTTLPSPQTTDNTEEVQQSKAEDDTQAAVGETQESSGQQEGQGETTQDPALATVSDHQEKSDE